MLELRPTCEHCNRPLPPDSLDARICSFECTFCATCVEVVLGDVCSNCGGGFTPRPIRPKTDWKGGNGVAGYPPSAVVRHRPVDATAHREFSARIRKLDPGER